MAAPEWFDIKDSDFAPLKDKVVVITGGSSGIGLATTKLLVSNGAKVVVGDLNECPVKEVVYQKVDVRDWKSQLALFKKAIETYGQIDHAFANAGLTSVATYMEDDLDDNGDLLPPKSATTDINLTGVIYTCKIAIHYIKKNPTGGSVLITASGAAYSPFGLTDYNVAKHGVLGLMRGLSANVAHLDTPVRVNALAPLWTLTGMVPEELMKKYGVATQPPEAVARSAALLMADTNRTAQTIMSVQSKFIEIDRAVLMNLAQMTGMGPENQAQSEGMRRMMNDALMAKK